MARFKKNGVYGCLVIGILLFTLPEAQATNVTFYQSFAGNMNFVTAGGTLRTADDGTAPCNVTTGPVSGAVSGIPSGATIEAAFLYWAGSGTTIDSNVTFNGTNVSADRTFTEVFNNAGTDYDFFGAFKDVTSLVSGNGSYSFNNFTVNNGAPWCAVSAVLSGWGLVVIYSHVSEDFRVVNVFDGLQQFRGSSLNLTPSNFKIPSSPINGRFAVLSWEGDVGNSATLGGFSENITFNGTSLTDAANPTNSQFNSTINKYGTGNNYYGVDLDSYDISSLLSAGQTSATTVFSSGGDLVLLNAQVVSVTNTPVSDLEITKTHSGNFNVNANGVYTIGVTNNGPSSTASTITVTDTLPTGLTYVSATGTGWSCSHSAPTVTCTRAAALAGGASAPNITLTVAVGNSAYPSVTNTASVSAPNFDNVPANNSVSDVTTVNGVDLSNSDKTYVDQNGGEANVGDVIRYTITLDNSSTNIATGVSVTDNIPANVSGFTVVSIPGGATNSSNPTGGTNGTGYLNITSITVPASSSVTVVFDVTVAIGTTPGTNIDNTANITVPAGASETPSAPSITVSPSLIPVTGTKALYLDNNSGTILTRIVSTDTANTQVNAGTTTTFTMTPAFQTAFTLGTGTVSMPMRMARTSGGARVVRLYMDYGSGGTWTNFGDSGNVTVPFTGNNVFLTQTFNFTIGTAIVVPIGQQLRLRIQNNSSGARHIRVRPLNGGVNSRVLLNADTVINVNSVTPYNATYPGGTTPTEFGQGETAYIRAVVADPFGSFDITGANITIRLPGAGTIMVNNAAMTQVNDSGAALKTYQYAYTIPTSPLGGNWEATVVAQEGTEGTITDSMLGTFPVGQAEFTVVKSSSVISDPINNTTNPKRIPDAVVSYSITVTNSGRGSPNANTVILTDIIPSNIKLCVSAACSGAADAVEFINGTPTSSLSFVYASAVKYSNQVGGGPPYTYTPVPNVNGYDSAVTGIQITPAGTMSASSGTPPHPNFTLRFRTKVK